MTGPPLSDRTFLGAPPGDWLAALLATVAVVLAIYAIRRLVVGRLARVAERTRVSADDAIVQLLRRSPLFLALFAASRVLAEMLALSPRIERLVVSLGVIALFVQLGVWAGAAIRFWAERLVVRREHLANAPGEGTVRALSFVLRLVVWAILFLVVLDTFDIDVTALIAGLGIGGIAIALAVQNILGDLLAALAIVLDKPFVVGDFVQVDEFLGSVQHVGIKTTRLRSLSGEEIVFPNANLLQSRIRNYRRMAERRVVLAISVMPETPRELLGKVPELIRNEIQAQDRVRFDRSHFDQVAASGLNFEAVYYVLTSDYNAHMDVKQAIWLGIVDRFAEHGIRFAHPFLQTMHLRGERRLADA